MAIPVQGDIDILGIYGHSAYHSPPADKASFDVNQVPMMFFDYRPTRRGTVVFGIEIDGAPLKDNEAEHTIVDPTIIAHNEVHRRANDFWIPQKYRTVGDHKIMIKKGHIEEYRDIFLRRRTRIVWDTFKVCTLTFTGRKMGD